MSNNMYVINMSSFGDAPSPHATIAIMKLIKNRRLESGLVSRCHEPGLLRV